MCHPPNLQFQLSTTNSATLTTLRTLTTLKSLPTKPPSNPRSQKAPTNRFLRKRRLNRRKTTKSPTPCHQDRNSKPSDTPTRATTRRTAHTTSLPSTSRYTGDMLLASSPCTRQLRNSPKTGGPTSWTRTTPVSNSRQSTKNGINCLMTCCL